MPPKRSENRDTLVKLMQPVGRLPTAFTKLRLSILAENSSFCWTKTPPPSGGDGFQFQPGVAKMNPAGEAEAGSAGVQPAEE